MADSITTGVANRQHPSVEIICDATRVDPLDRASRRYEQLVKELIAEEQARLGRTQGSLAAVARRLGMSHGLISKISRGANKGVGPKAIQQAIKRLGLSLEHFYGDRSAYRPAAATPLVREPTVVEYVPAAYAEWLEISALARLLVERGKLGEGLDDQVLLRVRASRETTVAGFERAAREALEELRPHARHKPQRR